MRSVIAHAMELARSSDVDPELDREGHKRTLERLREKYGDRGHLQLRIPKSPLRSNAKTPQDHPETETLRNEFNELIAEETATGRG